MEIIHAEKTVDYSGTVVALGNFDGIHTAHMKIIREAMKIADESGLKAGVLLFDDNTKNVVSKENKVKILTENNEKLRILEEIGIDFVYIRSFTEEFMRLSPEEYIRLLVKNLKAKVVCVGYDYRFGHMAAGTTETLGVLGKKYGFQVSVTDKVITDGTIVSSTYIRELIKNGETHKIKRFLGRDYSISGVAEKGLQNGRKIGFPTINVGYNPDCAIPKEGVYAGICEVRGNKYKSVINVGKNLTFGADKLTVESHLLDFSEEVYGEKVNVYFIKRLRDVMKFENADALRAQICLDVEKAKEFL